MENPPAFPTRYRNREDDLIYEDGMSLRDYAALQALNGIIIKSSRSMDETSKSDLIKEAFEYADEYLRIREESNEQG
jgi:hypothetical protein